MKTRSWPFGFLFGICTLVFLAAASLPAHGQDNLPRTRVTSVSIVGEQFFINGELTYAGRTWNGHKIEGLLLNSRMVQGIFDDRNPATVQRWAYPDTGKWDAERNTREFISAMPEWKQHGLLAITLNLQGGNPERYNRDQPWHNSAFEADGSLRPDYMDRLERILDQADEIGMVVILGYFYFGQDQRFTNEAAVLRATDNITQWLLERAYRNVLVEVNNECNVRYDHPILQPDRIHELITRVRETTRNHRRLYVGVSYGGGTIPPEKVARVSDFLLLHGNGVSDPDRIAEMVRQTRKVAGFLAKPILFNEDDHFDFDKPKNNFIAALSEYASWGYFDPGTNNYLEGYQSPPVAWGISTPRKAAFFRLLGDITGTDSAVTMTLPRRNIDISTTDLAPATIRMTSYRGWSNAFVLANGQAEAVIVPEIGRVMSFGFTGQENVFWENEALFGKPADSATPEWINFGGDKTWPAPEGEWSKYTRRNKWQPPTAFDGMPATARTESNGDVVLTTPVDPFYNIRVERRIHLDPARPIMTITTRYERVSGDPIPVSIWVITQLKEPVRLYAPLPKSQKGPGYTHLSKQQPAKVEVKRGLLSLERDPKTYHKIGFASDTLLWIGARHVLRIDAPREPGGEFPDQNSNMEIYTSPDPLKYIELETLGPIQTLAAGQVIERVNTYTLYHRTEAKPDKEVRRILGN